MKSKKMLARLNKLLSVGKEADQEQVEKLRKLLPALKDKQEKLRHKLENAEGKDERRKIEQRIEVIQQQRKKGVELYKQLKSNDEDGALR